MRNAIAAEPVTIPVPDGQIGADLHVPENATGLVNRDAMRQMTAPVKLEIVPGATHLFEEPGTLEQVMELAANWFDKYLR